jgi:peptidyl-prolyl cis-trans isomerase SurA
MLAMASERQQRCHNSGKRGNAAIMMPDLPRFAGWRRLLAASMLAIAASAVAPLGAQAQQVVVIVNGDPITAYDIEQRIKLIQVSSHRTASRNEVIEELIDEKLKTQLLRRYQIDGMDTDVENAYANMARRMRVTPQQFTEQLARSGVAPGTLKARIKAEITWSQVIRGRYQSSLQVSDKDVLAKLETRSSDDRSSVGYDYTLRPILFVVPRGAPDAARDARRREAEALRARFQGCEEGIGLARGLHDVAVRAPVTRSTADLAPALREILEKTEVGKLTSPEVTAQGVEVYALCGKKPSNAENTPGKREAREELFSAKFDAHAKRYLKELRSQAMIEYPVPLEADNPRKKK